MVNCTIPANADISGIGVRAATYAQNILSFVPAVWALIDNEVTTDELHTIEIQSVTILITAFSILISAILQAQLSTLSLFHVVIVLNLGRMHNTNTFIYFLLYRHHKTDPAHNPPNISWTKLSWYTVTLRPPHLPAESTTKNDIESQISPSSIILSERTFVTMHIDPKSRRRSILRQTVFFLGSFHLTLMSCFAIWVWSNPRRFEISSTNTSCSFDNATLFTFWEHMPLSSLALRLTFLIVYLIYLVPGFNMLLPVAYLLIVDRYCHYFCKTPSRVPALFGMGLLVVSNVAIIVINEVSIQGIKDLQEAGESDWSFGQILALLLISVPLRDVCAFILKKTPNVTLPQPTPYELPHKSPPSRRSSSPPTPATSIGGQDTPPKSIPHRQLSLSLSPASHRSPTKADDN